jgi:GntR family transcriptional regulator
VVDLIQISYRDPRPIYEQVKDGFRTLILTGAMRPDERMPSVRELATQLAINPNTIQRAYRELEQEGCICSVPGKGSFVADARDTAALRRNELLVQLKEISEELKKLGVDEKTMTEWIKGGTEHD